MSEMSIIWILLLLEVIGLFFIFTVNQILTYSQTSDISLTFVGYTIVDESSVVGASPVDVAPIIYSFPTKHVDSMDWEKTNVRGDNRHIRLGFHATYMRAFDGSSNK